MALSRFKSLADLFSDIATRYPENIALLVEGQSFTYAQLLECSQRYAAYFYRHGVKKGDRIGLLLEKSLPLYSAVLGCMMAGGVYVPLAPSYPADRLRLIAQLAEPTFVVFESESTAHTVFPEPSASFQLLHTTGVDNAAALGRFEAAEVCQDDVAYILFTSGSTGVPKGVMVSHGNAVAFVQWAVAYCSIGPQDRLSGHSDLNFDLSVFDTFGAFVSGAALAPVTELMDKTAPSGFIQRNQISIWFSVPSVLSSMSALSDLVSERLEALRFALFCGEPLLPGPVRAFMAAAPHVEVANLYGPTEATVACSAYKLLASPSANSDSIPIGWKTQGTEVFVWHEDGRVAEIGESGEIVIAGDQVALGYWRNDLETSARFAIDPRGHSGRCYLTGDIATVSADGPVFKGRKDHQIKFRGWRIELGEIEHALARLDGIVECAVALIRRENKADALAAFVRLSTTLNANAVLFELRKVLPEYMIPTHVRIVSDFPRTLNHKIDRKLLASLM